MLCHVEIRYRHGKYQYRFWEDGERKSQAGWHESADDPDKLCRDIGYYCSYPFWEAKYEAEHPE